MILMVVAAILIAGLVLTFLWVGIVMVRGANLAPDPSVRLFQGALLICIASASALAIVLWAAGQNLN
jgi:hypothetical protein